MGNFYYPAKKLPFENIVRNEAAGMVESEMYFEGSLNLEWDKEESKYIPVSFVATMTGFAQFKDGATIHKVSDLRKPWDEVITSGIDEFELDCAAKAIERAYLNGEI
jgi:hypothetical protein